MPINWLTDTDTDYFFYCFDRLRQMTKYDDICRTVADDICIISDCKFLTSPRWSDEGRTVDVQIKEPTEADSNQ